MAKRGDNSNYLYHWIKSDLSLNASLQDHYESAFKTLLLILGDLALKSGKALGYRTGHSCICFTETPVWFMSDDKSKYQPFGFEFNKRDIYKIGGEYVIYCSRESSKKLPQEFMWKWMIHEPLSQTTQTPYGIDFTWEREVRVNSSRINFLGPSDIVDRSSLSNVMFAFTCIYVPSIYWKGRFLKEVDVLLDGWLSELKNENNYYLYEMFYNEVIEELTRSIQVLP
ncbi:TPA: hypothetical protein UO481_000895 [Klebsiella pneumoniae]|nr:hypothetical protein [Klebsiella pneumoniae]